MPETTIFQKIIDEEIPCDKLYEDEFCIAFNDTATPEIYTSAFVGSVRCV